MNALSFRLAILTSHPIQYYAPLFRELARRMDVHVFFSHRPTAAQQGQAGFGQSFHWDIDLTSGYGHTFLRNVAKEPNVSRFSGCDTPDIIPLIRDGKFQAVLTLGWHLKSLLQGIWSAKRSGLPVMVRGDSQHGMHTTRMKRTLKSVAYPWLLRAFDSALFVGIRNRLYYEHYRYPRERLFHSPHCIDTQRFAASATPAARVCTRAHLGIDPDVRLILFAGKLVPFKRPLDVIDAAAQLQRRGDRAEVLVAGSGPLAADMVSRACSLSVPIHMLGFQNQTEMPAVYAAADVLVLPSTGRETWGLVCNEALACSTPIVVSDQAGCAPDLVADGKAGLLFRCGDIDGCAAAIAQLLGRPPARQDLDRVSESHSIERAALGVEEAVQAL